MSHSRPSPNPTGGDGSRRGLTQPALHEAVMVRVLDSANMRRAWKRVKANKGAPGVDGMGIEDFPEFARLHWPRIRRQLADGAYRPQPVRRVSIPKPGGGERLLGIPTVTDRVIQQAIAQVLTPIFDPGFSESSFGFRLMVNEQKSRVVKTCECQFLGFTFRGSKLRWSDRAFDDFKHNVRRLTGRSWGVSMGYRLHKLAQYVRGWMGYFGISDYYRPIPELDQWLRRRIRMGYWKRWRRTRTKVRNLPALGTSKRHAILTALSSKSYWHLSRTLATQSGMTNEWLKSQGLIDIRTMWMKAHGYA